MLVLIILRTECPLSVNLAKSLTQLSVFIRSYVFCSCPWEPLFNLAICFSASRWWLTSDSTPVIDFSVTKSISLSFKTVRAKQQCFFPQHLDSACVFVSLLRFSSVRPTDSEGPENCDPGRISGEGNEKRETPGKVCWVSKYVYMTHIWI